MTFPPPGGDKVLRIYLALVQYPILSTSIRARMRREIFQRGVITAAAFEAEVRDQAMRSQEREALHNPYSDEPGDVWEIRLTRIQDHLTDFYFAYNLPYELFEQIIRQALAERGVAQPDIAISFNPELAPQDMLFEHALMIEKTPLAERARFEARLREIKVVLIRTLISDQLAYVNIAKEWLTTSDLIDIRRRKIGGGKIGGKSAGMLLAFRILETVASQEIREHLHIPESYYLGADITYRFMSQNNLMHWNDQKYKDEEQIRQEYPQIRQDFEAGAFPPEAHERLCELLNQIGPRPLIVRSSSLLEDNFGTSFAGKYESHFCPNQGTSEENLHDLTHAIQMIYASIFNPDVLLYRRRKGLQDYDERMAILIQVVEGQHYGNYYLPHAAGVAFSRNLFRWSPQIRREDGFVRLVWGLGTRAVDRVGNDYPRLIALSHPLLHPQGSTLAIQHYSQHYVDLIDLKSNKFVTLPVSEVFSMRYPQARYVVQVAEEGSLIPLQSRLMESGLEQIVITFDGLLQRTSFASRLREMLTLLEKEYHSPVDTEFTVEIPEAHALNPQIEITLLQCRPQSHLKENKARFPPSLDPRDIVFSTHRVVPEGYIEKIRYVIFVPHETYFALPSHAARVELARWIGKLNARLAGKVFICLGPGRWGTSNSDLGVPIGYGDIYYTRALIELSGKGIAHAPEPSFGTHFFQDLLESNIYPLAIYLDDKETIFNDRFFNDTPNRLAEFLPSGIQLAGVPLENYLRLIQISDFRARHTIDLVMDDEKNRAVAFLVPDEER